MFLDKSVALYLLGCYSGVDVPTYLPSFLPTYLPEVLWRGNKEFKFSEPEIDFGKTFTCLVSTYIVDKDDGENVWTSKIFVVKSSRMEKSFNVNIYIDFFLLIEIPHYIEYIVRFYILFHFSMPT